MVRFVFKLYYWPIISSLWGLCSFIVTYLISTADGHVYPFFPYISDTGTKPPESCIFAQLLNVESVLLGITLYIRYRQVAVAISYHRDIISKSWNTWSLPTGMIACLGMSIVGNFQQTNLLTVHMLGAFMTFGIGLIYFLIQVRITLAFGNVMAPSRFSVRKSIVHLRVFLGALQIPFFFVSSIAGYISGQQFRGESVEYWTQKDGGFKLHLAGTITEWIMALNMMVFVVSFTPEFKQISFKGIAFDKAMV